MKGKSLIDVLHEIQEASAENYIGEGLARRVAETFKTTPSKVYGVITFYTMFSSKPRGKHIIRVCRSLSCHLADGEKIVEKIKEELGIDFGETTEDKEFTLEESSCLGMCSVAPSMMIDDVPFGNLKADDIPLILRRVREGVL